MSAQEIRLLMAMAEHGSEVTVTLLADPDGRAIRELRCAPEEMGLFGRTERLYCRLMDACGKHRVRVAGTTAMRVRYRFAAGALERVEEGLFADDFGAAAHGNKDAEGRENERCAAVEIWECSDPETEVRVAAQAIREWVSAGAQARRRCVIATLD